LLPGGEVLSLRIEDLNPLVAAIRGEDAAARVYRDGM
jgi:hypothetical protein